MESILSTCKRSRYFETLPKVEMFEHEDLICDSHVDSKNRRERFFMRFFVSFVYVRTAKNE